MAKVEVDEDEYRALCKLRDGAHEDLALENAKLREQYAACVAVNKAQVHRLATQGVELEAIRGVEIALRNKLHEANAWIVEMTPVATGIPQPAMRKG